MSSQKKCAVGDWNLKMTHIQNSSQIKAEYLFCGSCIQPVKFRLLAFWRKKTPFIDQNAPLKMCQKAWSGPPLICTKSKRTAFFQETVPKCNRDFCSFSLPEDYSQKLQKSRRRNPVILGNFKTAAAAATASVVSSAVSLDKMTPV